MSTYVVVGLQYGDEGKGKITDVLSAKSDYVVRFQEETTQVTRFMWEMKNSFYTFFLQEFFNAKGNVSLQTE